MNYIINPKWIYMIELLSNLEIISTIFAFVLVVALVIGFLAYFFRYHDCLRYGGLDKNEIQQNITDKKLLKVGSIITVITLLLSILIPTEKTMYAMLVASYTTTENVETAGEVITDTVDYIFDKVDQLLEDSE